MHVGELDAHRVIGLNALLGRWPEMASIILQAVAVDDIERILLSAGMKQTETPGVLMAWTPGAGAMWKIIHAMRKESIARGWSRDRCAAIERALDVSRTRIIWWGASSSGR